MLVHVLLDELMDSYEAKLEVRVRQPELSTQDRLGLVITICLDDICTKRTTHLFTELWALANHNPFIAERVCTFYSKVHDVIAEYVQALNPDPECRRGQDHALFISASMEGTTPFLGHDKPWASKMPAITAISARLFIHLAKTIRPGEIATMAKARS